MGKLTAYFRETRLSIFILITHKSQLCKSVSCMHPKVGGWALQSQREQPPTHHGLLPPNSLWSVTPLNMDSWECWHFLKEKWVKDSAQKVGWLGQPQRDGCFAHSAQPRGRNNFHLLSGYTDPFSLELNHCVSGDTGALVSIHHPSLKAKTFYGRTWLAPSTGRQSFGGGSGGGVLGGNFCIVHVHLNMHALFQLLH